MTVNHLKVMEKVVEAQLHGLTFRLEANYPAFKEFTQGFLAGLFDTQEDRERSSKQPDIHARLHWDELPTGWQGETAQTWGRRILQNGERILLRELLPLPGLQLAVERGEAGLYLDAYYRPPTRLSGWRQRLLPGTSSRLFGALVYYLVYFPLMVALEAGRGWNILHSAVVDFPDGSWLLAGLPGSGKSTLALAALGDRQARLISDNLVFLDGEMLLLHSCPEPVHLSSDSFELLPPLARERLHSTAQKVTHDRASFLIPQDARAHSGQPVVIFLLGLLEREGHLKIRPLSPETVVQRLAAADGLAKETMAYGDFSASLALTAFRSNRRPEKLAALQALCRQAPGFELWIPKGIAFSVVLQEMRSHLHAWQAAQPRPQRYETLAPGYTGLERRP